MTTSMIERVARAICTNIGPLGYDDLPEAATYMERKTHSDRAILDRQEARDVARAAIEAMREPTREMYAAAYDALVPVFDAQACWKSMIAKALEE